MGDKSTWEKGWNENLRAFRRSHDVNDLTPKYYHPKRTLRYKDDLIVTRDPNFEFNFLQVLRVYLFSFLKDYNPIYEFGCGTGFNLVNLAERYPNKELHGLDWVESSIKLIKEINKAYNLDIKPHLFDMFNPSELIIPDGSAVFTWGALEQLGTRFEALLDFLLTKKVFVINIEPLVELYNDLNPLDKMSIEYMEKRGYLKGYLRELSGLDRQGRISIQKIQRIHFGNMNYEGWSFVIWNIR